MATPVVLARLPAMRKAGRVPCTEANCNGALFINAVHMLAVQAREAELALAAKELQKHREKLEKEVKRLRAEDINMASLKTRWTKYTRQAPLMAPENLIHAVPPFWE